MGSTGDDRLGEVDQLLQELIPGEGNQVDGVARWQATEVPNKTVLVEQHREAPVEAPVTSSRFRATPILVVLAILAAGGIGYWLASARSDETAGSTVDDPQETAPGTTAVTQIEENSGDEAATADGPAGTLQVGAAVSSAEIETLRTELESIDLSSIEFAADSAELTERGRLVIAEVGAVLVAAPDVPAQVEVATFSQPTSGQNHGLSTQRAQSIVEGLIAEGVDPTRLAVTGRGGEAKLPLDDDGALLFDTDDPDLAQELGRLNGTVAALGEQGSLTPEVMGQLDVVHDAMDQYRGSSLTLIAHADGGSADASHDLSHKILDGATNYLTAEGVAADRLSTIGMGRAPIEVEREDIVAISVGSAASIAVAVAQIDTDRIGFESGTDVLTSEARDVLIDVAAALAIDPAIRIDVSAHSYTEATTDQNHELSHLQGDAVVGALVDAGVDERRLIVTGHGDPSHFAEPGRESLIRFDPVGP